MHVGKKGGHESGENGGEETQYIRSVTLYPPLKVGVLSVVSVYPSPSTPLSAAGAIKRKPQGWGVS